MTLPYVSDLLVSQHRVLLTLPCPDLQVRTVAKYFIEISCLEHRLLDATPSQIAAAGIWLARLVLDKEEWVRDY